MKMNITMGVLSISLGLMGCANEPRMGYHVALLKAEQTYNPNATQQNRGVVPDGTGERMEGVYNVYTGKSNDSIQSTGQSQMLGDF
ncbi:hypothetical protein AB3Y13_19210 [Vibrio alginolyticus]